VVDVVHHLVRSLFFFSRCGEDGTRVVGWRGICGVDLGGGGGVRLFCGLRFLLMFLGLVVVCLVLWGFCAGGTLSVICLIRDI